MLRRVPSVADPALGQGAASLLALGCALDALVGGRPGSATCLAFWCIAAGVAFGAWSALFSALDWFFFARLGEAGVYGLSAFPVALVVGLFGMAMWLRAGVPSHAPPPACVGLEVAGATILCVKNWIVRELAQGLGSVPPRGGTAP